MSNMTMDELLARSAALHHHLCPRQVLGVRMGMLAGKLLCLDLPQDDKRLFVFLETDGCTSDGVAVASGASVGHRWHAQLLGYQRLADDQLLIADPVVLTVDLEALISHAGARAVCVACGEEIINRREILRGDDCLCRACAGEAYYTPEPCLPIADARSSRPMPADLARLTEARI
jgi:formylmethanofuran dehydrogenase subunit E